MAKKKDMTALDEQVMENLRRIYRQTAEEPVPARLLDLLDRLRAQEAGRDAARDSEQDTPGAPDSGSGEEP